MLLPFVLIKDHNLVLTFFLHEHPFYENIWFNPNMKKDNSAICSKSYIEAGIVCIIDLFNED